MADSKEGDHFRAVDTTTTPTSNSSFSQLLFSDDDNDIVGLNDMGPTSNSFDNYSSSTKLPKMLSFGGYDIQYHHHHNQKKEVDDGNNVVLLTPQKSGVTCSDSSSASSANNITNNNNNNNNSVNFNVINTVSNTNRKRNGSGQGTVQCSANTIAKTQRTSKKTKMDNSTSIGQPKVRKEKLGERISALQQLVSPFGKTDTASVLHEAMGYIRFLHDQVQVLCSPYLQHQPEVEENREEPRKDLRSRGLCLVPVECTHVASSNGADYWSPAMVNNFSSYSSAKQ